MNSIQAELLELYGMLGDSVEKYKKCVSDILDKGEIKGGIIRMCERVAASGGTPTPYSA